MYCGVSQQKEFTMSYQANVYRIIIASPGDVLKERQIAREVVYEWNDINSLDKKICLLPVGWEHNSSPEMGGRAQDFINKQILENSDLLIGIFWTRIGSSTGDSVSGSVEEIKKHMNSGKPAMLYFSNAPVRPDDIDQKQHKELVEFKEECSKEGLVESFDSIDELRSKLTKQLSLKITQHGSFRGYENGTELENQESIEKDELHSLQLSQEEKDLIIEAAKSRNGLVMKNYFKEGFCIQSNGKQMNKDSEPRTVAIWEATIDNLTRMKILKKRGDEIFALTHYGFKIADKLTEGLNEDLFH